MSDSPLAWDFVPIQKHQVSFQDRFQYESDEFFEVFGYTYTSFCNKFHGKYVRVPNLEWFEYDLCFLHGLPCSILEEFAMNWEQFEKQQYHKLHSIFEIEIFIEKLH